MKTKPKARTTRGNETNSVGYKRPPARTRFKPGQSGNPRGRPKGRKNFQTILNEILSQKVTIREGDKIRKVTKAEAVAMTLTNHAMKGNAKAITTLLAASPELTEKEAITVVIRHFGDDKKIPIDKDIPIEEWEEIKRKRREGEPIRTQ